MKNILLLIICVLLFQTTMPSQVLRPIDKAQVIVHTKIIYDSSIGFIYYYYLTNKENSAQAGDSFDLKVIDSLLTNNIRRISKPTNKKWYFGGIRRESIISGSAANRFVDLPIPPEDALFPSETMSISFKSSGLPAIMPYYAQSFSVPFNEREQDSLHLLGYTFRQINPSWKEDSYKSQTVAPNTNLLGVETLDFLDTLTSFTTQSRILDWIKDDATANKYLGYFTSVKTKLIQRDSAGARNVLLQVLHDVDIDSASTLTSEAYALLRFNTEYLVNKLPQTQTAPFFAAKLVSSTGTKLTTGSLQYYEGSWKDARSNQDGTFSINTSLKTLSLRMTYEYGTQTKSNVPISTDTIVFQTINTQVQLQNSQGVLIDTGTVQYYAGAWRSLGTTTNGIASKELLPGSYSFRMSYAYASKDKQQDVGANPTVVFQTVNASVQLQNSQGALMDQGTVQYYSGAWRTLGTTTNGVANKELLPNNYSFRMTYAYASKDKQQDIGANPAVVFQTVNAALQLQNSQGTLIDTGVVQYYSGAWRSFGTTTNGVANKELLPNNYSFRMSYAYASKDKQQDISSNPTVVFQTVNAQVRLVNSQGNLIDQGSVQYYSGAWRSLGTTTNGIAVIELLPNAYSFRMTYEYVSLDKSQDISTNSTVNFATVLCTVRALNSQSQLLNNAQASYYSGAWRQIGSTVDGVVTKELLPVNLTFRLNYNNKSQDKAQNLSTNNIVEIIIP